MAQNNSIQIDRFDRAILEELARDSRQTQAMLADRVGLSPTAVARRQKTLEDAGYIKAYHADLDLGRLDLGAVAFVTITLDSQSDEALDQFEQAVSTSPSVMSCHLMSGAQDYLLAIRASSLDDFARIHRAELAHLPRVSRMESHFALKEVVNRPVPLGLFGKRR
jgi:DNA-binding Lrp family transcriptional regulator